MEYDKWHGWHVGRNGYDRYVLPRARSSTLQAVFLPHRLKSPIFCEKKILIRFPARFSLPSMPLGTTLRVTLRMAYRLFLRGGAGQHLFIIPCKESLMPAASSRSPHLTKATKAFVDAITAENNPPSRSLKRSFILLFTSM